MHLTAPAIGPFALLLDPESVFTAMQRSERLSRLHSRICHPLDKPLMATAASTVDDDEGDAETELGALDGAARARTQST